MKFEFKRIFTTYNHKGTRNYIDSQKKYEIIRTIIYFFLPISLFIGGYVATKTRVNLLTVVAVVGLLPASKSLIGAIMFLRYKSCSKEVCDKIAQLSYTLSEVYDMVFTTYDKNFVVGHMVIAGNTVCGYSEKKDFSEKDFQTHIVQVLKMDGHKNVSVKIFTDLDKYLERIEQLETSDINRDNSEAVVATLKSVAL